MGDRYSVSREGMGGRPAREDGRQWRTVKMPLTDKEYAWVRGLSGDMRADVMTARHGAADYVRAAAAETWGEGEEYAILLLNKAVTRWLEDVRPDRCCEEFLEIMDKWAKVTQEAYNLREAG